MKKYRVKPGTSGMEMLGIVLLLLVVGIWWMVSWGTMLYGIGWAIRAVVSDGDLLPPVTMIVAGASSLWFVGAFFRASVSILPFVECER